MTVVNPSTSPREMESNLPFSKCTETNLQLEKSNIHDSRLRILVQRYFKEVGKWIAAVVTTLAGAKSYMRCKRNQFMVAMSLQNKSHTSHNHLTYRFMFGLVPCLSARKKAHSIINVSSLWHLLASEKASWPFYASRLLPTRILRPIQPLFWQLSQPPRQGPLPRQGSQWIRALGSSCCCTPHAGG